MKRVKKTQLRDTGESILATRAFIVLSVNRALDSLYLAFAVSSVCPHLNRIPGLHLLEWRKRASMLLVCFSTLSHSCTIFVFSPKGMKHRVRAPAELIWMIFQGVFFFIAVFSPLWHKWIPIMLWCMPLSQDFSTVEEIIDSYQAHSSSLMQLVGTRTFVSPASGKFHNNQRQACLPEPQGTCAGGWALPPELPSPLHPRRKYSVSPKMLIS